MNSSASSDAPINPEVLEQVLKELGQGVVFSLSSFCGVFLISLYITIWGSIVLMSSMNAVPERHRRMVPGLVWLSLIPFFVLIWAWFLAFLIPDSLRSAFKEASIEGVPDGRAKGLAWAISVAVAFLLTISVGLVGGSLSMPPPSIEGDELVTTSSIYLTTIIQVLLSFVPMIFFILFFLEVKSAATQLRAAGKGA
jgi:uncharacterized BrkB/YihY/UPF0761 family membrane protein